MAFQSFTDFLKTYAYPYQAWASKATGNDIQEPDQDKLLQGWVIEKPRLRTH